MGVTRRSLARCHVRVAAHPGRRRVVPVVLGRHSGVGMRPTASPARSMPSSSSGYFARKSCKAFCPALSGCPRTACRCRRTRVARLHDAAAQVEPAVAVVVPAHLLAGEAVPRAGAVHPVVRRSRSRARRGRERLVGGRGGVRPDGAVQRGLRLLGGRGPTSPARRPPEHPGERGVARQATIPPSRGP